MAIVRRALCSFAILVSLFGLFAWWLLSTQSGLQWAINLAPDILQVKSIEGDVSDFSFKQLQLKSGETILRIEEGSLQWKPLGLFSERAQIDNLELNDVVLQLPRPAHSEEPYAPWQGLDLPVDVVISKAIITQLSVSQLSQPALLVMAQLDLTGEVANSVLNLDKLILVESENMLSIQGRVDLSARPNTVVDLSHSVTIQIDSSTVVSQGAISGTWSSLKLEQNFSRPLSAKFIATIDDALTEHISWNAVLTTEAIKQQNVMGEMLNLGVGQFKIDGEFFPAQGLAGLTTRLVGQISGGNTQLAQWQGVTDISMNNSDLKIDKLRLDQIGQGQPALLVVAGQIDNLLSFLDPADDSGIVDIRGNWSSLTWPLDGMRNASGKQNAVQLDSDGHFTLSGTSLNYNVLATATGQSQGKPFDAEVDMLLIGGAVDLRKIELTSGDSIVTAKGSIGQRIDLSWALESPDIGDFLLGGEGSLSSSGKLSGDRAKPRVHLQAASPGLSFLGYSANHLKLSANVSLSDASEVMDIRLNTRAVQKNQTALLDNFDLVVNGRLQEHNIAINATLSNQATLKVNARGGLIEDDWKGKLNALSLNDPLDALWALRKEVDMQITENTLSVSRSCLVNQAQSLCFEANKTIDAIRVETELRALDLASFDPLFRLYGLSVAGQVNGKFLYLKDAQHLASKIDGYLESISPVVSWDKTDDGELSAESLIFEAVRVDIMQDQNLQGAINISLSSSDRVSAEFAISAPIESPNFMQAVTQGKAAVAIADLSILPTVLLDTISLNGELTADVQLAGTLATPKINASAAVMNARFDIPELGLQLENLALDVDSDGASKINLNGQLRSGSGSLGFNGNVDFTNIKAPEIELNLYGEDLQLANTPELKVVGDVDLTAKFTNQLFDLQGDVVIDKAELDSRLPETALLVSDDVILIGVEQQQAPLQQRLKLTIDLGEQTHINSLGLDADLQGELWVFQEPDGILRCDGQITIDNGRYRAYGQDLKIDQGRLIFSGGSIENPSLDLKAEKEVESTAQAESITAGVSVTGRASAPQLNLYSTPSMQDEDILSVLIFDKPVGELASKDGLTLLRIANSLRGDGTSGVTKMTEKLEESLGLTSLELQLGNDAPSIVAGKQFSSKFYIGYGYGLLDAAQSLILRYKLNKAWSIKADFGVDSGADLRYQLER